MRKLIAGFVAAMLVMSPSSVSGNGETLSPNMNLTIPGVGVTIGPQWATDINTSLNQIDLHDHSNGKGVQITPAGINISSDLSCNTHNFTGLRSVRLNPYANLGAFSATASDVGALFEAAGELYYRDASGNSVKITSNGFVNSGSGSISGMGGYPNASAAYDGTQGTFVWQQAVSTPANLDAADIIIRYAGSYPTPAGNYIAIQAPSSLATGYAITLPATTPASSGAFLTESTAGAVSYTNVDNSTVEISSSLLRVKDSGITTAKIVDSAVTAAKLANGATQYQSQTFTSSGTFTTAAGVTSVLACGRGGAGGGGGGTIGATAGGGGGGGAVTLCMELAVSASTAYTITIGAAGSGGSASGQGGNGGDTSFGSLWTWKGAKGGAAAGSSASAGGRGVGGLSYGGNGGATGDSSIGQDGSDSFYATGGSGCPFTNGGGGGGAGDGAGGGTTCGGDGHGLAGTNGGGGGGGTGASVATGGAGTAGKMTIYWLK